MKLSLDANLLPITHAAGGEADIVYEYSATKDYPAHTLLLEATLADSTNQRRMEMEPVSRHLGNHILKTNNHNSYCVFATNYLQSNVISDFRMRKTYPYYDPQDDNRFIDGMKIIPLQTSDLRIIIMMHKDYPELYRKYESAYQKDFSVRPKDWYETCVKEREDTDNYIESKKKPYDIHSSDHRDKSIPIEYDLHNEDNLSVPWAAEETPSYGKRKEK